VPGISSLEGFDSLADRIRLHRQADSRRLVIIEGPDDATTLEEVLEETALFPANGRFNALAASLQLYGWKMEQWAVVVDRDFDGGGAEVAQLGDRYYPYSEADLEAMLVSMGCLERLLLHHGSGEKLHAAGGASAMVHTMIENSAVLSSLRQANHDNEWGLAFDKTDLAKQVDKDTLAVKVVPYCQALLATNPEATTLPILLAAAEQQAEGPHLFRGRDVVTLAGVALRRLLGSLPEASSKPDLLCDALRGMSSLRLSESDWLDGLRAVLAS
jgi:hypothetical protein